MPNAGSKLRLELQIDVELAEQARRAGIDLAAAAESGISDAVNMSSVRDGERLRWLEENREAFDSLRRYAESNELPGSEFRRYPWLDSTSI